MEIYKILLVTISIFLISDFENLVISVISNKISGGAYEIWQQLVTPWSKQFTETSDVDIELKGDSWPLRKAAILARKRIGEQLIDQAVTVVFSFPPGVSRRERKPY